MALQERLRARKGRTSLPMIFLVLIALLATPNQLSKCLFVSAANDDQAANDDANANGGNNAGGDDDDAAANNENDDGAFQGDDKFQWDDSRGYDEVSVMPVSCVNYNNGHMIKFDFYDSSEGSYQCHFNHIGSFVVSIAHYMRAYFNLQALTEGQDFQLPGDAGYLNCILLQDTAYADKKLYAKIGCMDRETYTSTKLQIHVYTDDQCSVKYNDGESNRFHSTRGYEINGYYFSTRVSFRPPFYSCQSCQIGQIADTFNKKFGNWYDDDYIAEHGRKENNGQNQDQRGDDDMYKDDYFQDDASAYMYANDDVGRNDDAGNNKNDDGNNKRNFDDDYYTDDGNRRVLEAAPGQLEAYHTEFWAQVETVRRKLYEEEYDIGDWNMCQRLRKYGVWCDDDCQALDAFRVDQWSKSDIFLLVLMCFFLAAMLMLVVAKRLKASQKARIYGDENYKPGLPPLAMALIFVLVMAIIVTLAMLKFVNETLVFAVVTCILLFIYMLKLTLFESRRPVLLAAPRHDIFDSPLDDRFFS